LAAAQAAGAYPDMTHAAFDLGPHPLEVGLPGAGGHVVGVADIAAEGRALAADLALFGHVRLSLPNPEGQGKIPETSGYLKTGEASSPVWATPSDPRRGPDPSPFPGKQAKSRAAGGSRL